MKTTIDIVLDFSKIEANKVTLKQVKTNLETVIEQVGLSYLPKANDQGLDLFISVDPMLPTVILADQSKVFAVLSNLLNNALKYTKTGKIVVSVRCVTRFDGSCAVKYCVRDTGLGMTKDLIHDIVSHQYEIQSEPKGIRLGLLIVQDMLKIMKSALQIESQAGQGTSMSFQIQHDVLSNETLASTIQYLPKAKYVVINRDVDAKLTIETYLSRMNGQVISTQDLESTDAEIYIIDQKYPHFFTHDIIRNRQRSIFIGEIIDINHFVITEPFAMTKLYKSIKQVLSVENK